MYQWPGNVRELRNTVERLCILYPCQRIEKSVLPVEILSTPVTSQTGKEIGESKEKTEIRKTLIEAEWNQSEAARRLGITLSSLRRKIKKYGISKN